MNAFAVVHVPRFPIVIVQRDLPALVEQPLLLVTNRGSKVIVVAASEPEILPGGSLRRTHLLCPHACVRPHEAERDQAALLELRAALDPISPRVALLTPSPDVAFAVDLGQTSTRQVPQLAAMLKAQVVKRVRIAPAICIATSQTVAHRAALVAQGEPEVVPIGAEAVWLAPHPIDLLPIDPALTARLHQFGLRTIGAVARPSCDALEAQFGGDGRRLFELSHGRDPLPLATSPAVPPLVVGGRFAGPVANAQILEAALAQIAARLASRLLRHGQAVRHLTLSLTLELDFCRKGRELRARLTEA